MKDDWPPYSPDLSPMENLWARLNQLITANGHPQTDEQLKVAVIAAWMSLDKDDINAYVRSFPGRLQAVLQKRR
jgi:hypothetical protein